MVILQFRANRKPTGGRYKAMAVRRQYMSGNAATLTKLGTLRKRTARVLGGATKERVLTTNIANVFDPKAKKFTQAKISTIVENPANRNFARRNIMTKGTVIETTAGRAKITNSPGQDGAINAVLLA